MLAILPGLKGMLNYHPLFVHYPIAFWLGALLFEALAVLRSSEEWHRTAARLLYLGTLTAFAAVGTGLRSEEHTSELQSRLHLVCRLLLEKKKNRPFRGV